MKKEGGMVRLIVLIVVALLILSYLGISVRDVVDSPAGQSNFQYVKEITLAVWNTYFKSAAEYLWRDVWVNLMWHPFIEALEDIKAGRPTQLQPPVVDIPQ
jgi:hypothetical protein